MKQSSTTREGKGVLADWKSSNLKYRIFSALVGIPLFLLFIYLGEIYLAVCLTAIILFSFYELMELEGSLNLLNLFTGWLSIVIIGAAFYSRNYAFAALPLFIAPAVLLAGGVKPAIKVFTGSYYLSLLFFLLAVRYGGLELVVSIVVLTWIFDIFSYFGGVLFGKHPLAPAISPGKSLEGLFSGLVFCIAASLLVTFLPLLLRPVLALIIGVTSISGDLIESKIKRIYKIKDSGSVIPGHGGFLDRFDSMTLSAVAGYLFFLGLGLV